MGVYDEIAVPCPTCGDPYYAQSKSGPCTLSTYQLYNAPADVLGDVNRHAPFECDRCHAVFYVALKVIATAVLGSSPDADEGRV